MKTTWLTRSSEELNRLFLEQIVPVVLNKDQNAVSREYARVLQIVSNILGSADLIAHRLGMAIA